MKTVIKYSHLLILLFTSVSFIKAQSLSEYNKLLEVKDEVKVTTDRSIYAAGETILFKADYRNNNPLPDKAWSTILYVEFIKPDGSPILQKKFQLNEHTANGALLLPKDLYTGIYFIKVYTKWMRNFSVDFYAYKRISVVNTNNNYLIENIEECEVAPERALENNSKNICIKTDKKTYKPRSEINLSIELKTDKYTNKATYSVSVVRKGSKKPETRITTQSKESDSSNFKLQFLPEIDGLTISGTALNKQSNEPAPSKVVFLTLMNDLPYSSTAITTVDGRFYFRIPHLEYNKDFLVMANEEDQDLAIILDNEFCQRKVKTCNAEFTMSDREKQLAYEIAVNAQITASYISTDTNIHTTPKKQNVQFYGTPNRIAHMGEYIDLPYIEEFIFELVPEFSVSHRKGVSNIFTSTRNTFSPFPVLVMVDNIPVSTSEFLKIRTNKIDRLELVDDAYILGCLNFNGLINAISNNGDMGGIDLPANATFFNYELLTKESSNQAVDISKTRTPYRPNCLYWNPNLTFSGQNKQENISFYSSDVAGEYQVIVESVQDGHKQFTISEFTIE